MGVLRLTSRFAAKSRCNMQKQIGWKSAADGMISVTIAPQPTSRISKAIQRGEQKCQQITPSIRPIQRNLTVSTLWNLETPS